jgi:phosphoglycolate phosphatase
MVFCRDFTAAYNFEGSLVLSNVFFDLDGTLTDPKEGIIKCFQYSLNKLGLPYSDELEVSECIGPPLRATFRKLLGTNDEFVIEKAVNLYRERFGKYGLFENILYPGILDLLATLHENSLRLYVVTTKPKIFADRIVEHFQLDQWFSDIFGTDLNGRFDDKGEHIEFILNHLKLAQEETVMIGDRRVDILAGKMNHLRTIGVTYGYGSKQEIIDSTPDHICDSPSEIQIIIMNMRQRN